MKKRTIKYITVFFTAIALLTACKKDFLEVALVGDTSLESNYYKTPEEAFAGLVSVYDPLGTEAGGIDNTYANRLGPLNAASDDCFAGGGGPTDMDTWQAWNKYTLDAAKGPQGAFWSRNYTGIYRANLLLTKLNAVPGLVEQQKNRFIAEAKWLRAYYYFNLVRLFKNVPLFTAPIPTADIFTLTQAKPTEVYAQIEKDLNEAIPALPPTVPKSTEGGRITMGAAKALLGKVLLYQNDNGKMLQAATIFEDINKDGNAYGYRLVANYANIFRPDNKFNSEAIFEVVHTTVGNGGWGSWPNFEGNVAVQMFGARSYSGPVYLNGWGFNPITMDLVNVMKNDPRYPYTIANIDSLKSAGVASYEASYQNTGYFIQKFAPLQQWKSSGNGNYELNFPNDEIEIRLADTYLMEAEALVRGSGDLVKAAFYLNAVRARVGLGPVAATLDNIYNERRLELATEGHRWFDLVRTGRAAAALASKGFVAGKHEILPIPLTELNNTKLVQNPQY
jgi:hypothetical protein